ncbi:MAG: PAC2 family protein [Candidatus Marsarchaeota archaeon]|nr:PAC2 family protein [Candidatus Marsarchaeota archaeon]
MDKTTIYYNKREKMSDPVLIVGLPGIGTVGSLVGEHLKGSLKAKRFATLYSPHFLHQAIMLKNGGIRLASNRFYCYKNPKTKRTIIILVGDMQAGSPEGQYDINERIVRFFKSIGGKEIYTIGGYNINNQYVQSPRVFAVATAQKTRDMLGGSGVVIGKATGAIWGSAGLIVAFAKKYGIPAACLMGETGMLEIDANAAKAVLEKLEKILDIEVDLSSMDKIKAETEKLLRDLEKASGGMPQQEGPPATKQTFSYIR